ncbi:MAG TPA: MarR family transcriptional regulator [Solirubrobacteraceae bacterium]|nr:MarR family transcriptional regulator [Solirubrobacteraceae bacterium]
MQAIASPTQLSSAGLARDIGAFFVYIQRTSGQDFLQAVDELDLSLTQVKALHMLAAIRDERSLKALAQQLSISLPAASRAIEGLHQRGLIERHEDTEDRRMKRVRISDKGANVVDDLSEARHADLARFVETLSGTERKRLAAALAPVLARTDVAACRHGSGSDR